jgi:hypothetical protein
MGMMTEVGGPLSTNAVRVPTSGSVPSSETMIQNAITVKLLYNDESRNPKFVTVVDILGPQNDGRCGQVVVSSDLTVLFNVKLRAFIHRSHENEKQPFKIRIVVILYFVCFSDESLKCW